MRFLNLVFFTFLSSITLFQNSTLQDIQIKRENFEGEWIIDLRPTPNASPYLQSFIVSDLNKGEFNGIFYGSPISETSLNKSWDKLYFAFKSSDSTHDYYQSGYVLGDEIFGITYCPGRDFVMPWTGTKKKD